jgi:ABC-2 type transport system permease protein
MGSVYLLTLRQLSGKWRLSVMLVLAAMPVFITTMMVRSAHAAPVRNFEIGILGTMLAGSILPLIVLVTAAAAFGNEVEDRTLANLTISPTPRWQIVLPKLLAIATVAGPLIAVTAGITAHVAFLADTRATIAVTTAALLAVLMYGSMFMWLGLISTQAIGLGLLYVVLWEGFFSGFVSGVRLFSIRFYSIALMHAMDPRRFAALDHLSGTSVSVLASLVVLGFFLLTVRRLRQMDIP